MKHLLPALMLGLWLTGCGQSQKAAPITAPAKQDRRETIYLDSIAVDIAIPATFTGKSLLLLPGWNYPRTGWCDSTDVCRKAFAAGYALIMPEMGKSIYATRYYLETRNDWRRYPTLAWLMDTLVPHVQQTHGLLKPAGKNYVLGLSTGGRGVAQVCIYKPGLFCAGAALSGDFAQHLLPQDNLTRGVYGPFERFPERWRTQDNPFMDAEKLTTPLYLGHGLPDKIAPAAQTQAFYDRLRQVRPDLKHRLRLDPSAGHNYAYWGAEADSCLKFFDEICP